MSDARDTEGNLLPDEERFTKFGDFLRNSSLDELPELINVLKGEMSLVGPRPLYAEYLPYYTKEESLRHTVKAGITGLAQINGRNLSKWDERFAYDVKYVKELSFINDVKVLWRTFFKVAGQEDIGQPSVEEELPLNLARSIMQAEKIELVDNINSKYGKTDTYIQEIKEIGGEYFLCDIIKENTKSCSLFGEVDTDYVSTCRSAIKEILDENDSIITKKVAFVPSFTCHVCVEPFVTKGYQVYPYSINKDLTINIEKLLEDVEKLDPAIILVHSYFGLNTISSLAGFVENLKEKGILVIEDLTHGMWGDYDHLDVPYHIGSIRKWLEIPDGAFVEGLKKELSNLKEDVILVNAKTQGMLEKGKFLAHGIDNSNGYRKMQSDAESLLDTRTETFRISSLSASILNQLDIDSFKRLRRGNYNKLYYLLSQYPSIKLPLGECNNQEVPFMLPVFVPEGRKQLQQYLVENKIFPTVIWACPEPLLNLIDENARYIYEHILCFHCDQRYNEGDMERISSTINMYYKHHTS